ADFQALGAGYVAAHESTFASIRYYGDRMAAYLAAGPGYSSAPLLAELAQWEWEMASVFDAADADPITTPTLAQIAPEEWAELRFDGGRGGKSLELKGKVRQLGKGATEETDQPEPALAAQPQSWLLWRQELQIFFRPLSAEETAMIAAARVGESF